MSKYAIINVEAIQQRIEELEKERKKLNRFIDTTTYTTLDNLIKQLQNILSQSTPLIPQIEKAMDVAREIKDDSAHDTFTAEDISGCTEVCTYGWRYKTTNENYISNLKLDI